MNKQSIAKLLDTAALIAIFVIFALYIFKKMEFAVLSVSLIAVAILKMGASMLKASFFGEQNKELIQERDFLKERVAYLEKENDNLKTSNDSICKEK